MADAGWWFATGVIAVVLIYGSIAAMVVFAVLCDMRETRRRKRVACAPDPHEEPGLACVWNPADLNDPAFNSSAILTVLRTQDDEVSLIVQPADGSDEAAILMPRRTSQLLGKVLGRARYQEVQRG